MFSPLLLSSCLLILSVSYASTLEPRRNYHSLLRCQGELPIDGPPGYNRALYADLTELCAWGGRLPSLGCDCFDQDRGCAERLAHPVLFAYAPFLRLCLRRCNCPVEDSDQDRFDAAFDRIASPISFSLSRIRTRPPSTVASAFQTTPPSHRRPPRPPSGQQQTQDVGGAAAGSAQQCAKVEQVGSCVCGGTCSGVNGGCGTGTRGQCRCTARRVGAPAREFIGQCSPIAQGGGMRLKREVILTLSGDISSDSLWDSPNGLFEIATGQEVPCPCNTSYVSYACCNSLTGLVWEASVKKLGQLNSAKGFG